MPTQNPWLCNPCPLYFRYTSSSSHRSRCCSTSLTEIHIAPSSARRSFNNCTRGHSMQSHWSCRSKSSLSNGLGDLLIHLGFSRWHQEPVGRGYVSHSAWKHTDRTEALIEPNGSGAEDQTKARLRDEMKGPLMKSQVHLMWGPVFGS